MPEDAPVTKATSPCARVAGELNLRMPITPSLSRGWMSSDHQSLVIRTHQVARHAEPVVMSTKGDAMGKEARIALLLGASFCLLAVMADWVVEELHQHEKAS